MAADAGWLEGAGWRSPAQPAFLVPLGAQNLCALALAQSQVLAGAPAGVLCHLLAWAADLAVVHQALAWALSHTLGAGSSAGSGAGSGWPVWALAASSSAISGAVETVQGLPV